MSTTTEESSTAYSAESRRTRKTLPDYKTLHRTLNPALGDDVIMIPLDPSDREGGSRRGFYEPALDLPWFVERLTNEIRSAYATVSVLAIASVTGLDCLSEGQLDHALSALEDQLERCAAMGERATRLLLANRQEERA